MCLRAYFEDLQFMAVKIVQIVCLIRAQGNYLKLNGCRFSDIMLSAQPFGYFTMAWHFSEPFYAAVLITILCCVSCLHYPILQLYCHCTWAYLSPSLTEQCAFLHVPQLVAVSVPILFCRAAWWCSQPHEYCFRADA